MNIDFDKLYLNAVESALKSSEDLRDKFPESDSLSKQLELIAKVSAFTTVQILKDYHQQIEDARNSDQTD